MRTRFAITAATVVIGLAGLAASEFRADRLRGRVQHYSIATGDSLQSVGARFGVDVRTLAADNALDARLALPPGTRLLIDNRHIVPAGGAAAAVLVNVPQRMLFFGAERLAFPVATGRRDWPTPLGSFTVVERRTDPAWHVPESILEEARRAGRELPLVVPPGPANPLGRFWLGLSGGGIGIHGTNAPRSIYGTVTHGCIRLHPDDIAWLFPLVSLGTSVAAIYEPVLLAEHDGAVFLEVHPDVYRRVPETLARVRTEAGALGLTDAIDWQRAETVAAQRHGIARDVTARPQP